jgi:hypothetical protein
MKAYANWAFAIGAFATMTGLGFTGTVGCSSPDRDVTGGAAGSGGAGGSTGGSSGATGSTGGTGGSSDGGPSDGAGGGNADGGSTPEEACLHVATAQCQKYVECRLRWLQATLGDFDTCVTQYVATLCRNRLGIEGTSETPATLEACAAARTSATCAQWLDNDVAVSACLPLPGALPTGAACGTPAQCQTMNCEVSASAECGRCGGPLRAAGAPCLSGNQCEKNLQCFNGTCALPGSVGASCSNSFACQYPLSCMVDRCAVSANEGESCATKPCNDRDGLICNRNVVCEPWQLAGPGEPCNNAEARFCSRAGFCVTTGGSTEGTCVAAAALGEPCNDSVGPFCLPWARCIRGVCTIPDPGMCK